MNSRQAKIQEETMYIPGTDGHKMSKSRGNIINIFLDDKALRKQIMSIETDSKPLEEYINATFTKEEQAKLKSPKYFYQVTFDKPGGLPMPIIVQMTFEDGTTENHHFPAQIWRMNDKEAIRTFATQKAVTKILVDPKQETADIDVSNNTWPKEQLKSKFD